MNLSILVVGYIYGVSAYVKIWTTHTDRLSFPRNGVIKNEFKEKELKSGVGTSTHEIPPLVQITLQLIKCI